MVNDLQKNRAVLRQGHSRAGLLGSNRRPIGADRLALKHSFLLAAHPSKMHGEDARRDHLRYMNDRLEPSGAACYHLGSGTLKAPDSSTRRHASDY
jgi:hypothetical protein